MTGTLFGVSLPNFVIGIVLIVTIGSIVRAKYGVHRDRRGNEYFVGNPNQDAETKALQAEIRALQDRIQVLERIATDSNHMLASQIEELRSLDAIENRNGGREIVR